ncbi:MAG: hypothetical protein AAGA39_12250, partial [Pseudomonadota bacterium]
MTNAPKADKRPTKNSRHGEAWTDDYAWMRDDNWQEVLRDPSILRKDVHEHLTAEGAYYAAQTDHL